MKAEAARRPPQMTVSTLDILVSCGGRESRQQRWSPPLLLFGSLKSQSVFCCCVECSPIVRWIIMHNQNSNWTCLLDGGGGGGGGVWQTDEKQTAAGKTKHYDDLITFFRTSSTITSQLLPPFNGHVVKWNISCHKSVTWKQAANWNSVPLFVATKAYWDANRTKTSIFK